MPFKFRKIQGIPFLRQLSLSMNAIKVVQQFAFTQLPNLQLLDLSDNYIDNLPLTSIGLTPATIMLQGREQCPNALI